uniref:Uncharacterized protein n=1 Tax=Medicago truncatula TaxID=3880 RepID=I3SZ04_MEDTR|nr:unknown [Medicago truncatula]
MGTSGKFTLIALPPTVVPSNIRIASSASSTFPIVTKANPLLLFVMSSYKISTDTTFPASPKS